jgi:hypothetical protein
MENPTTVQKILRSELSFYGAIIGTVIAVAGFYFGLSNQMNLIAQRLDQHIDSTSYVPVKLAELGEKVAVLINQIK